MSNFFETIMNAFFAPKAAKWGSAPPRDPVIAEWLNISNTGAGIRINSDNATEVAAVEACVKVISESIAQLPLVLYQEIDGKRVKDTNSPLYRILHDEPNPWQTSFEFREMMARSLALRGNAYAKINVNNGGQIVSLVPLSPDRVKPFWANESTIAYRYMPKNGGDEQILLQGELLHIKGWSNNLLEGKNPIEHHREAIALAKATEQHGATLFKNGAQLSGILKHPKNLSEQGIQRLRDQWYKRHTGVENAHKPLILEEDMEFIKLGMTSEDAQFLQTRKYQVAEIARIFRVPLHMIGDLDRATFSNIEQQSLEFVQFTMMPWLVRFEQAISKYLLTNPNQFARFNVNGLLRGDIKSRYEAYSIGRQWGWINANEIRSLEDMDAIENGDQFIVPMNMTTPERINDEKMV